LKEEKGRYDCKIINTRMRTSSLSITPERKSSKLDTFLHVGELLVDGDIEVAYAKLKGLKDGTAIAGLTITSSKTNSTLEDGRDDIIDEGKMGQRGTLFDEARVESTYAANDDDDDDDDDNSDLLSRRNRTYDTCRTYDTYRTYDTEFTLTSYWSEEIVDDMSDIHAFFEKADVGLYRCAPIAAGCSMPASTCTPTIDDEVAIVTKTATMRVKEEEENNEDENTKRVEPILLESSSTYVSQSGQEVELGDMISNSKQEPMPKNKPKANIKMATLIAARKNRAPSPTTISTIHTCASTSHSKTGPRHGKSTTAAGKMVDNEKVLTISNSILRSPKYLASQKLGLGISYPQVKKKRLENSAPMDYVASRTVKSFQRKSAALSAQRKKLRTRSCSPSQSDAILHVSVNLIIDDDKVEVSLIPHKKEDCSTVADENIDSASGDTNDTTSFSIDEERLMGPKTTKSEVDTVNTGQSIELKKAAPKETHSSSFQRAWGSVELAADTTYICIKMCYEGGIPDSSDITIGHSGTFDETKATATYETFDTDDNNFDGTYSLAVSKAPVARQLKHWKRQKSEVIKAEVDNDTDKYEIPSVNSLGIDTTAQNTQKASNKVVKEGKIDQVDPPQLVKSFKLPSAITIVSGVAKKRIRGAGSKKKNDIFVGDLENDIMTMVRLEQEKHIKEKEAATVLSKDEGLPELPAGLSDLIEGAVGDFYESALASC